MKVGSCYCPEFAPIELLWAFIKNRVASEYQVDRELSATAIDVYDAFCGGAARKTKTVRTAFGPERGWPLLW